MVWRGHYSAKQMDLLTKGVEGWPSLEHHFSFRIYILKDRVPNSLINATRNICGERHILLDILFLVAE